MFRTLQITLLLAVATSASTLFADETSQQQGTIPVNPAPVAPAAPGEPSKVPAPAAPKAPSAPTAVAAPASPQAPAVPQGEVPTAPAAAPAPPPVPGEDTSLPETSQPATR